MKVLVAYASRYGSTQEIADFIAEKLRQQGIEAEAKNVTSAPNPGDYGAVVLGSAVYMGHWMEEAVEFVKRNHDVLASRPVWLFSSGPLELGPDIASTADPKLEPKEIKGIQETIHPQDHRIFFGALVPAKLGFSHRTLRKLPAARAALPEGDFRNWNDIEGWAIGIARILTAQ